MTTEKIVFERKPYEPWVTKQVDQLTYHLPVESGFASLLFTFPITKDELAEACVTAQKNETNTKAALQLRLVAAQMGQNLRKARKLRVRNPQNQGCRRQRRRQSCKRPQKGPNSPQHNVTWEISNELILRVIVLLGCKLFAQVTNFLV